MKRIEKYELIERYLLGTANPEEKAEVESRLKIDTEFAQEVELHRNMQHLLFDHSLLEIKDTLQKIRTRDQLRIRQRTRFYRGLMIVSFCAFISTISLLLLNRKDIAVRPASEAPIASEAFSDTLAEDTVQNNLPVEVQQVKKKKKSTKPEDVENTQPTVINNKEESSKEDKETGVYIPPENQNQNEDSTVTEPALIQNENSDQSTMESELCNLKANYLTEPSCNINATGAIQILGSSILGGKPPYQTILNGEYNDLMVYRNLKPGLYQLELKDATGCIKIIGTVTIHEIICVDKDSRFSPEFEVWEAPLESGLPGILTIYNKAGQMVYQLKFDGSGIETWNGNDMKNEALPFGVYPFIIRYDNGNTFEGTVTIVR